LLLDQSSAEYLEASLNNVNNLLITNTYNLLNLTSNLSLLSSTTYEIDKFNKGIYHKYFNIF